MKITNRARQTFLELESFEKCAGSQRSELFWQDEMHQQKMKRPSNTPALLFSRAALLALILFAPELPAQTVPATPASLTVPAGTKVLLALRSGINTRSAQPGDGVYLASAFPVTVGNRVAIPAGVYVQGVIDRVERAGRIKGRAQVSLHFTTMIFANGSVVEIPGTLNDLPGVTDAHVKKGSEGQIEQAGSKGKDAGTIARGAEAGAGVGAIGGAIGGSPLAGAGLGAAAGGVTGLVYTLLTRGNDVNLQQGETVEMTLGRPLTLTPVNLSTEPAVDVQPSAQRPLPKPGHQPGQDKLVCPPGSLGCS